MPVERAFVCAVPAQPTGEFQATVSCVLRRSCCVSSSSGVRTQKGFSKSFGGGLAQIRAIQAWNSERRAWSSAEEFDRGGCAHAGPEDKCAPSSRAVFARGERAGGEGLDGLRKSLAENFFRKAFLLQRGLQINCNKRGI